MATRSCHSKCPQEAAIQNSHKELSLKKPTKSCHSKWPQEAAIQNGHKELSLKKPTKSCHTKWSQEAATQNGAQNTTETLKEQDRDKMENDRDKTFRERGIEKAMEIEEKHENVLHQMIKN